MHRLVLLLAPVVAVGAVLRGPRAVNITKVNVTGTSKEESRKISEACESACARGCKREKVSVTETELPNGGKKTVTQWREVCELQSSCVTGCETDMYQCIDKVPEVNFNHTKGQISPCQTKVLEKYIDEVQAIVIGN